MKIITFYTESQFELLVNYFEYSFADSIECEVYKLCNNILEKSNSDFGTIQYINSLYLKTSKVLKILEKNIGEQLVICDIDILFINPIEDYIKKYLKIYDIVWQRENKIFNENNIDICGGFVALNCSQKVIDFYKDCIFEFKKRIDNNVNVSHGDQTIFKYLLKNNYDINYGIFGYEICSTSLFLEKNIDIYEKFEIQDILLFHANCTDPKELNGKFLNSYEQKIIQLDIIKNKFKIKKQYNNFNRTDKLELVISRYNENIKWVEKLNENYVVYNKGNFLKNSNNVPNIGRESETYLKYIIQYYYNLPEIIIFTQANPFDHCPEFLNNIKNIHHIKNFKNLTTHEDTIICDDEGHVVGLFDSYYSYKSPDILKSKYNFSEWCVKFLNKNEKDILLKKYQCGAIFAVTRESILNRNLEYYKKLYSSVSHGKNLEECHYFERTWNFIFHNVKIFYSIITTEKNIIQQDICLNNWLGDAVNRYLFFSEKNSFNKIKASDDSTYEGATKKFWYCIKYLYENIKSDWYVICDDDSHINENKLIEYLNLNNNFYNEPTIIGRYNNLLEYYKKNINIVEKNVYNIDVIYPNGGAGIILNKFALKIIYDNLNDGWKFHKHYDVDLGIFIKSKNLNINKIHCDKLKKYFHPSEENISYHKVPYQINENFSVLIQGPIHENILKQIKYCRNFIKKENIFYSAWYPVKNEDIIIYNEIINHIGYDNIRHTKLPIINNIHNFSNIYYQSYNTLEGLYLVKTKYVIKIRSDEFYGNLEPMINYILECPNKITSINYFFRKNDYVKYHISDHCLGGQTKDLHVMFNHAKLLCENVSTYKTTYFQNNDEIAPEIILCMGYLQSKGLMYEQHTHGEIVKSSLYNMNKYFRAIDIFKLKPFEFKYNDYNITFTEKNNPLDLHFQFNNCVGEDEII
jgi:hypothetical protein